ncbi:MAG: BrnT family toxin, partial [Acidobacteria bacterium]|nr:BrnT family toxin [Acidobacteriota bacterium]
GRILVVVHIQHDNMIRIISARRASSHERRFYDEG